MKQFIPKKQEKEVISIRISSDVLEKVDKISAEYDISRNELINQCIQFALEQMESKSQRSQGS